MLLPKRVWRDIPGYEGKYQVSNDGKVRSLNYRHTGKKQILKERVDIGGYAVIGLCKDGKEKKYKVHRLIALAFIPNPNNLPYVNHKDENKTNNHVSNLEWCTAKYNVNYGTRNERHSKKVKGKQLTEEHIRKISENNAKYWKGKKGKDNPNSRPILMYSKDGEFIKRFDSVSDASEYLGRDRHSNCITECTSGRNKTAYGYKWKYEEDCK